MKQKGQALVEFVLILPIIILILLSIIDVGNIFMQKHELNNSLETVTSLYQANNEKELKAYVAAENLKYETAVNGQMIKITVKKPIKVNAPLLSNALGKNYEITSSKMVYQNEVEVQDE